MTDIFYNDYEKEEEDKKLVYYQYLQNDLIYQKNLRDEKNLLEKRLNELIELSKKMENENKKINSRLEILEDEQIQSNNKIKKLEDEKIRLNDKIKKLEDRNQTIQTKQIQDDKIKSIQFDNNPNNRFNGIISYLINGNPDKALNDGIIGITASSGGDSKNCIIKYNDNGYFRSDQFINSWICIDFRQRRIKLSEYSLRSGKASNVSCCNPQNWSIEGSNDSNNWKILDSRTNNRSIDGKGISNTFKILPNINTNEYYRYIRIYQTGVNTGGKKHLKLDSFEVFGDIQNP